MLKRLFDFVFSSIGLLVLSPIFLCIAILIKIDSPGDVLFRQLRVGQYGNHFRIHKFRTMYSNSDKLDLLITVGADKRITRAGSFLRKYKLDELPQLLDVWLGNMSLVGPRPEVPLFVAYYSEYEYQQIFSVRPGITDNASIEFKDENEILKNAIDPQKTYVEQILPIKISHYIEYVSTRTLLGDIVLIFKTIKALMK